MKEKTLVSASILMTIPAFQKMVNVCSQFAIYLKDFFWHLKSWMVFPHVHITVTMSTDDGHYVPNFLRQRCNEVSSTVMYPHYASTLSILDSSIWLHKHETVVFSKVQWRISRRLRKDQSTLPLWKPHTTAARFLFFPHWLHSDTFQLT